MQLICLFRIPDNTMRNSSDGIFNNSVTDLANETVALRGSVAAGYAGSYTIGLSL